MPSSGIAAYSLFHESGRDDGSCGDVSDRCERFSIGTAGGDDDDFGLASTGANSGETAQTLEEWIQSESSSRPTPQGNVDKSYIDVPPSANNSDTVERSSDTEWNLVQE
jgi:hypothetical protein